jgi:holo-[acyl-carrier protein] synthase
VVQDAAGKPGFALHPNLERLVSSRGIVRHHLTISDEQSLACACVVLEAE